MKIRNHQGISYETMLKREKFINDLDLRGMTISHMKYLASENHYSPSMIVDLLTRDYNDIVIASGFSRNVMRSFLIKNGVKHDNKKYLKLPQEVKLQFKFSSNLPLDEIKNICKQQSRKGAKTTINIRRQWKHYIPKNHAEYYSEQASSAEEAEQMAFKFRSSKSPFSKLFSKYKLITNVEIEQQITELARNRGIKGLLSMRTGVSLLEKNVSLVLTDNNINHSCQYRVGRYVYDIYVPEKNLIIEINGTYWHADPRVFQSDEKINFPYGEICASEKWHKDAIKVQSAINHGYNVDVLWEIDLKREGFLNDYISRIYRN